MKKMMRLLTFCASFIVALLACGCESEHDRYARAAEKQLAWIETANAARSFEADFSSGGLHFLSVCGVTCFIPGVNRLNAERCYPAVLVKDVPGTSDGFFSERQQELQARVVAFSREYNLLVASSERAKGTTTCKGVEDWDAGFFAMSKALQSLTGVTDFRSESLVTIAKNSNTFEVILPRNVSLKPFKEQICAVLAEHGLSTAANIRFRVEANEKNPWQEISCGVRDAN